VAVPEFPVPDAGAAKLLDWMMRLDTGAVEALLLRLYTNNFTSGRLSVTADFTEATFAGYSERTMLRTDFGAPTIVNHVAQITLTTGPLLWTPTASGQVIYGAFVIGSASLELYAARRFTVPRTMSAGVPFLVLPVFKLQSVTV
jgi:hypothetical protein